jgi:hypothetical protein
MKRSLRRLTASALTLVIGLLAGIALLIVGWVITQDPSSPTVIWVTTFLAPITSGILIALLGVRGIREIFFVSEPEKPLVALALLFGGAGVAAFLYGWTAKNGGFSQALLLVAAMSAAISVGTLLGFLFGIPRFDYSDRVKQSGQPDTTVPTSSLKAESQRISRYRPSTNLDDVADWLTKLIVGIGLSQINKIGPVLTAVSKAVLGPCDEACASERGFVSALIVFGTVCGFLFGYMWTRLHYGRLAARSDMEVDRALREDAASVSVLGVGKAPSDKKEISLGRTTDFRDADQSEAEGSDDPNKGKFGGKSVSNGRALRATIEPSEVGASLYRVRFTVTSIDKSRPLDGIVTFHLHPTFREPVVNRPVQNGLAELTVISYGAFTAGAIADGGRTMLELDLSRNPDATPDFLSR